MPSNDLRQRGVQIVRPIIYGNTARMLTAADKAELKPPPDHTHRWTVALRSAASHLTNGENEGDIVGGKDDLSYFIKRVTFKLHDSIPNPTRVIDKPPFETTATGWGEFEIQIRVAFTQDCNEKPITLFHMLKLHAWQVVKAIQDDPHLPIPPPIQCWQYDEIVFTDPQDSVVNNFVNHPPTPFPPPNLPGVSRPVPWHQAWPKSVIGDGSNVSGEGTNTRGVPGFHNNLAKQEGERLKEIIEELKTMIEQTRSTLEQKEKEVQVLRSRGA